MITITAKNAAQVLQELDQRKLDLLRAKLEATKEEREQINQDLRDIAALKAECRRVIRNKRMIEATCAVAKAHKGMKSCVKKAVSSPSGKVSLSDAVTRLRIKGLEIRGSGSSLMDIYKEELNKD